MADLLTAIAPQGVRALYSASDGMIWYYNDVAGVYAGSEDPSRPACGDSWRENLANNNGEQRADDIRVVCEVTLDHFQDFVDELTATPWPGDRVPPSARAEVDEEGCIVLFFVFPEHPELPQIDCGRLRTD
jgi:hypothetical protein